MEQWGFIKIVKHSVNQYTSNIIGLSIFDKAPYEALDKAFTAHGTKQVRSTVQSIDSNKNSKTVKQEKEELFILFYDAYGKKQAKDDALKAWMKIDIEIMNVIIEKATAYAATVKDKQYQPLPASWLNGKRWNDELILVSTNGYVSPNGLSEEENIALFGK